MTTPVEQDNWPTYAETLGRKTTETLDHWLSKRQQNVITARELYVIVSALYTTTTGIVPRDVTDTLVAVDQELKKEMTRAAA